MAETSRVNSIGLVFFIPQKALEQLHGEGSILLEGLMSRNLNGATPPL